MPEKNIAKIIEFYRKNRRLPSYSEIMELQGFRSKNSAFKLIKKMIEHGLVSRDRAGKIIPGKILGETRMLGTVRAGFPSPAEEELADTISLDDYLIGKKEATYLLKVTGDSMIEAGIMPDDMALVERGVTPRDGDIVIAEVDHEWTMKYFKKSGGRVMLVPANKKYATIIPKEELKIAAVVRAVIRKY